MQPYEIMAEQWQEANATIIYDKLAKAGLDVTDENIIKQTVADSSGGYDNLTPEEIDAFLEGFVDRVHKVHEARKALAAKAE